MFGVGGLAGALAMRDAACAGSACCARASAASASQSRGTRGRGEATAIARMLRPGRAAARHGLLAQFTTVQRWPSRPLALAAAGSDIEPFDSAARDAPASGGLAVPE